MQKIIVMALLLSVSQLSAARVYMCVDENTGDTYFTDKGCTTAGSREEVRVKPANLDSGKRYARTDRRKTWNSEKDERKTGLDYNEERRALASGGLAGNP